MNCQELKENFFNKILVIHSSINRYKDVKYMPEERYYFVWT